MSFLPLPDDTVIELQNKVFDLWEKVHKERNYDCVAGFLVEFKKASIKEFGVQGPQAYWFCLGLMVGGLHDRQLIKTEIDALSEKITNPYPEKEQA